jgi:acetyl-CoA C-acetyltransferase
MPPPMHIATSAVLRSRHDTLPLEAKGEVMPDAQAPILVGAGQLIERDVEPAKALEPLAMLERVARDAAADAGSGDRLLRELDAIALVASIGWRAENAPRLVAERLGAKPRQELTSAIGGETPITLVNHVARQIRRGDARIALVAGNNNVRTRRRARKEGVELDWTSGGEGEPTRIGENRPGSSEREVQHGLNLPISVYPIFENALRAHRKLDLSAHRRRMGVLMARFTDVAARNPYAWFPVARSAEELTIPSPDNRMVGFPYTKYLNAVIETDQAAGVLMMSLEAARSLGIPEDRWVYWWGGLQAAEDPWFPSERPDFARCPALKQAVDGALAEAGGTLDEMDFIDFYSCFPVAVEMACEMLGLDEDDPRGFTVTGGLPYAGGPGNNYTLHALAAMIERLRSAPGSRGLVTGNGFYLTKHSALVCSTEPKERASTHPDDVDPGVPPEIVDAAQGPATVETYTVLHDRDGAPERGIVIGRLQDDRRFIANTPEDRVLLEDFEAQEEVGRAGRVTTREGRNLFEPR